MKHNGMKIKILLLSAILATCAFGAGAQKQRLSSDQVQTALTQMRNYKHRILAKDLDLTKDQEERFFVLYDKLDDELIQTGAETREMERKALADAKLSDTECNTVSRALFQQKMKEAELEMSYYEQFADILTPRQLLKLKSVERKIALTLAKYHGRQEKR